MSAPFHILDRHLDIDKSLSLDASAGTGKTFSIEHLVTRLLMKEEVEIENILVVTFTRAAASELKERIWSRLSAALTSLESGIGISDYLLEVVERGGKETQALKRKLERALHLFDGAQIFTLHGFCERMLREEVFVSTSSEDQRLTLKEIHRVIRNFFRTELNEELITAGQLDVVLQKHFGKIDRLEESLKRVILRGEKIETPVPLNDLLERLNQVRENLQISEETLLKIAPNYKGTCDRKGGIKPNIIDAIHQFSGLFSQPRWGTNELDCLIYHRDLFLKFLTRGNQKKTIQGECASLEKIEGSLGPLIEEAAYVPSILAKLAKGCRKLLDRYQKMEDKVLPDDLLKMMNNQLKDFAFCSAIQGRYRAVIIDEFQDTDPLQWQLIQTLFPPDSSACNLYIVGDPKQSIYAFRNADLYSYLEAQKGFKKGHQYQLTTNWRSTPPLVQALNTLFSSEALPSLFSLPSTNEKMIAPQVTSGREEEADFSDKKGSIHFFIAEEKIGRARTWPTKQVEENFLFPFIAEEILHLKESHEIPYKKWAVLVRDRYQAQRFSVFCKSLNIPTLTQREKKITDVLSFQAFRDVLAAVITPEDATLIRIALGGPIFGWKDTDFQKLAEPNEWAKIVYQFQGFYKTLNEEGIASLFEDLLESCSLGNSFTQELRQIVEVLMEEESAGFSSPVEVLRILDGIDPLHCDTDPRLLLRQDLEADAVQILTLHMSKGLEFDFVVALGLTSRTPKKSEWNPTKENFEELDAEKMRQLYVAMTRSKKRLYVPVASPLDQPAPPGVGEGSPIELYMHHLKEGFGKEKKEKGIDLLEIYLATCPAISSSRVFSVKVFPTKVEAPALLIPPAKVQVPGIKRCLHSFSSLANSLYVFKESPQDFEIEDKTFHTLPAGASTGIMLHDLMQKIPFSLAKKGVHAIEEWVFPKISNTSFENWKAVISEIIFGCLTSSISIGEHKFSLSDISEEDIYKEMEFYFPKPDRLLKDLGHEDALQGFIDCVFKWNDLYFLLDWKSNWLGSGPAAYSKEAIHQSMVEHKYYLQAKIYREAFKRYLNIVDSRPFEECFGGVFYVFMRAPFVCWVEEKKC